MKAKIGAMWVTFNELDGLINVAKLARDYLGKSAPWLQQRINGYTVNGKVARFKEEEYGRLAAALREIAGRINGYADAIDGAEMEKD